MGFNSVFKGLMWSVTLLRVNVYSIVDYVFGVRYFARATSLAPKTQSTPPHSGPPTYYNIKTIHHIAVTTV